MIPGINTGGGGLSADWGSEASNQGGATTVGGVGFGDYNPPAAVQQAAAGNGLGVPLMIGGGVLVVGLLLVLAVKK